MILFSKDPASIRSGTVIISIIRNDTIWIGADSRLQNTRDGSVTDTACKIIKTDEFVFAHSGLFNTSDGAININRLFDYAAFHGKTMNESMQIFENILSTQLEQMDWKTLSGQMITPGDTIADLNVTALFARSDKKETKIYILRFNPVVTRAGNIAVLTDNDTLDSAGKYMLNFGAMGNVKEVMAFVDRTGTALLESSNPSEFIQFLIREIASKKHPRKVGGPVDIIRLTHKNIQWITVKKNCRQP